jgi:hypothetical protein
MKLRGTGKWLKEEEETTVQFIEFIHLCEFIQLAKLMNISTFRH